MKKRFFSLQYKFFLYFLLLSVVPTVLTGFFSYYRSSRVIIDKAKAINAQKLESVASNMNSIMSHVNEVSHLIIQSDDVKDYLSGHSTKDASEVLAFLSPFVGYNNAISTIRMEGINGKELVLGNVRTSPSLSEDYKRRADELNGYYFWDVHQLSGVGASFHPVKIFAQTRQFRNMFSLSEQIGYISIEVLEDAITDTYSQHLSSPNSIFLIINESGEIIHSNRTEYEGIRVSLSNLEQAQLNPTEELSLYDSYVISTQSLSNTDWKIVDLTPSAEILKDNQIILKVILSIVICNVVICILLAIYISHKQLAPLRTLCHLLNDAGNKNFNEYSGTPSNDEIGILTEEFNKMSNQLEVLLNKVYAAQLKQSEAEFQALQSQINPHFLYNTLDTIYWVCRLGHTSDASELVKALSDMFRLSLSKGEGLIPLRDEIQHLMSYLTIQKKRCKTSVDIRIDIDDNPELLNAKVIKLILQPLVENAFIHGLPDNTKESLLKISIKLEDNTIIYIIQDNGVGINPEFVKELNSNTHNSGFGIHNVNERIKLLFGSSYGIHISSHLNEGTTIYVRQPLQHSDKEKGETAHDEIISRR
ncbi:sensor histidine kinase [Faecalicatena sp. Marseille-Q4148]|nr:sensor histidine kinase [Faecalicatena sp. Marseille-Q4148]